MIAPGAPVVFLVGSACAHHAVNERSKGMTMWIPVLAVGMVMGTVSGIAAPGRGTRALGVAGAVLCAFWLGVEVAGLGVR